MASETRSDIVTYLLGGSVRGVLPTVSSSDADTFLSQDLAISTALFFQGVLCGQLVHYLGVSGRDPVLLKLFVAGLALLTTLKTVQVLCVLSD